MDGQRQADEQRYADEIDRSVKEREKKKQINKIDRLVGR